MASQIIDFKGEMSLLNVLVLHGIEQAAIQTALEHKYQEGGRFLERSPVILDCQALGEQALALDFSGLKSTIASIGLIPVGIRGLVEEAEALASAAGWALLRAGRPQTPAPVPVPVRQEVFSSPESAQRLLVVDRPVRSGQQIYCPDGDIVVMQQTSAGSELLAGGSVHVYGVLRGRVLAGVQGDVSARIFCQRLEAELIAIAGRYRLLDEIDTNLKGQAVMIYLEQEKLKIVPI